MVWRFGDQRPGVVNADWTGALIRCFSSSEEREDEREHLGGDRQSVRDCRRAGIDPGKNDHRIHNQFPFEAGAVALPSKRGKL
ncbi:hypothetical protein ACIBQ0_32175 [Nocardia nova]|uniref:hypothetical protein n=2 Tax=Nocardia TaxID=1817 RepID=UPI0026BD751E